MVKSSVISGFYKLPPKERLAIVADFAGLTEEEKNLLQASSSLSVDVADHMVENFIGVFLNLGVTVNLINGRDYLFLWLRKPSVIAAATT